MRNLNQQLEAKVEGLTEIVSTSVRNVEEGVKATHTSARKKNQRPSKESGLVPSMIKVDAPELQEKDKQLRALLRKIKQQKHQREELITLQTGLRQQNEDPQDYKDKIVDVQMKINEL